MPHRLKECWTAAQVNTVSLPNRLRTKGLWKNYVVMGSPQPFCSFLGCKLQEIVNDISVCSVFTEETEGCTEVVKVMFKSESWLPLCKLAETRSVEMQLIFELIGEGSWGWGLCNSKMLIQEESLIHLPSICGEFPCKRRNGNTKIQKNFQI